MKKVALVLILLIGLSFSLSWAQCPKEPLDNGVCDTLYVELFDSANGLGTSGFPRKIYFPLFVSNDLSSAVDSIAGFTIPLSISHTNPAVYCSVSNYWNQTPMGWWFPGFSGRSIYRHLYMNPADPYDTTVNRMADMEGDWSSRGWDMTFLELCSDNCGEVPPHFWLTIVPTGSADQRWWEGSKTLLATMTLEVYDSMTIYIDSTFWPPASSLTFARSDGELYVPRPFLPCTAWVSTDTSYMHCAFEAAEDVHQLPAVPTQFALSQNYPNPFNASTTIEFGIPQSGQTNLEVYNILGRKVETLVADKKLETGTYKVTWNSLNMPSGVYFYKLSIQTREGSPIVITKKMILLK